MTDHIPTIIHIAAWVYVVKQFLPFIIPPTVIIGGYVIMRGEGKTHDETMKIIAEGILDGVKEALDKN